MTTQFTPCPACGAVGEVGRNCQFCGTAIILKEGAVLSDVRVVKQRTVTPQQYAEKISIYHNIVALDSEISKVSIGGQEGIINLNGDIIYPLGNEPIKGFKDKIVQIGNKFLNLENLELVKNPYYNELVLEKVKLLSNAILRDASEMGVVEMGIMENEEGSYDGDTIGIFNTQGPPADTFYGLTSQLMIVFCPEDFTSVGKASLRYERLKSCDDYNLFNTIEDNCDGAIISEPYKLRYVLCGHDAERCVEIALRVLAQVYDIQPEDAHNYMSCFGGTFQDGEVDANAVESSNSGCAGMFALMLSIGAASVYGLIELIGSLIA